MAFAAVLARLSMTVGGILCINSMCHRAIFSETATPSHVALLLLIQFSAITKPCHHLTLEAVCEHFRVCVVLPFI